MRWYKIKIIFQKWWDDGNKQISLINYKDPWTEGTGRIFRIRNNRAKRNSKDTCFDFTIEFGYLIFSYTNFAFNK